MAAVDPEILVSRQNDGISKPFGRANQARVGESRLLSSATRNPASTRTFLTLQVLLLASGEVGR